MLTGLSVLRAHRFVVVVGEWVVEPGLDDRLVGLGRVVGRLHPQPNGLRMMDWAQPLHVLAVARRNALAAVDVQTPNASKNAASSPVRAAALLLGCTRA